MRRRVKNSRKGRHYWLLVMALTLVCGCEDVITVDLRDAEPQIVIEGIMSNYVFTNYFIISRTTDFYDPNVVERVTGATITVTDSLGDSLVFMGNGRGEYYPLGDWAWEFERIPGRTYNATVTLDGVTYTAATTMPYPIEIDSLRAEYQEGGGIGTEEDEGYRLHVYFQDVADRADYARIKLAGNDYYYLYDGRYSDGNVVDYEYFFDVFEPGDWASVGLHALDRTMYYYFLTLSEVWASEDVSNFLDATPANPNTNWSGGALGYFGAFNIREARIEIPESAR